MNFPSIRLIDTLPCLADGINVDARVYCSVANIVSSVLSIRLNTVYGMLSNCSQSVNFPELHRLPKVTIDFHVY